ncbi:MAG: acyltransferase, partial [Actinomycetota bacterium]|nr:acyltransferase [Actinomycetota bacterium]
ATDSHGAPTVVRPEIQALRAVAVMTVVVFHLWPDALPGGFIGVDVFFAISGFLITLHLLREVERTGRVSIPGFWARRARRILPAALVVLLFCAITTITLVPQIHWNQFFKEIRASTAYVENWQLASDAVDYQAQDNAQSIVQHFWSLSAEEQFYLVWPVLIVLAIALVSRQRRHRRRKGPPRSRSYVRHRSIALVLGTFTAASLAYSILHTDANPLEAYFVTPTRAWEFGAGGLLALLALRPSTAHPGLRALVSWAGMGAIIVTVFTFSEATPFPSYTALLPILGTVAVMWAGAPTVPWAATPLLALPPVQFLGNVSYSIYLWHWPLIVLAPFALKRDLDTPTEFSILVLTILAAWITKVLVEDPVRRGPFLTRRKARYTFAFAAVGTAIVLGAVAGGDARLENDLRKAEKQSLQLIASKPKCFGAASRDPEIPCKNPKLRRSVQPRPAVAARARNQPCTNVKPEVVIPVCAFGASKQTATKRFALMGDSHAQAWRAAMTGVAKSKGWQGLSVTHTGCGFTRVVKKIPEPFRSQCVDWVKTVPKWFATNPEVDTVFVVGFSGGTVDVAAGKDPYKAAVTGYMKAWATLPASVKHIIVLRDNPLVKRQGKTAACVERAIRKKRRAGTACRISRRRALLPDPAVAAAQRLASPRVQVINLTRFLCDKKNCFPVIGGALVYKDLHHLTRVFSTTLAPYIARYYDRLAAGWPPS